jgi:hypothetical protein
METNKILAEQFSATNNKKDWFAPLQSAVNGLTAEQAVWKNENLGHSILQIVNHLIFWNGRLLLKLKGGVPEKMNGDNDSTFENAGTTISESEWKSVLEKLNLQMNEFENEILKCTDSKLASPMSEENKSPWYSLIGNTNLHNSYHTGQIVLIRKMQGSWDSKKNGVN